MVRQPAPSLLGSFLKTVHTCVAHHNASCLAAHRTQIQGPASGLLWLEVARTDTCVSPLWSGLSHELTVMLLPAAWVPNQTLRQGEAQHAVMPGSRVCSRGCSSGLGPDQIGPHATSPACACSAGRRAHRNTRVGPVDCVMPSDSVLTARSLQSVGTVFL